MQSIILEGQFNQSQKTYRHLAVFHPIQSPIKYSGATRINSQISEKHHKVSNCLRQWKWFVFKANYSSISSIPGRWTDIRDKPFYWQILNCFSCWLAYSSPVVGQYTNDILFDLLNCRKIVSLKIFGLNFESQSFGFKNFLTCWVVIEFCFCCGL